MNQKTTLKLNKEFKRLYFKGKSAVHPLIVTYASKTVWDETGLESRLPKKLEKPFAGIAVNALFALRFIRSTR